MLILKERFFFLFFFQKKIEMKESFFTFSFFYFFFFNVKDGATPLFLAAQNGHEQTVQILLEKGKANVDLPDQVLLLVVSFSFFLFQFLIFLFFFNVKNGVTPLYVAAFKGHEQIVQILLEKGNPNVDLPDQVILLFVPFSFSFFFFFSFSFLFFFNVKNGRTPFLVAARNGHEQIVQILLEKGKANVDLPDQVILLIVPFSFSFFSFSFLFFFLT